MSTAPRIEDLVQYRPKLVRFARARLLDSAHAEDAVQETLLAAIESIDQFSGGSSLSTWLTGILRHKIVDCVRRSAKEHWHELDNDGTPQNSGEPDFTPVIGRADAPAGWRGPEDELVRQRLLEALDRCMRKLPERGARALLMRDVIGYSTAETCRELAVSESNCWVLLHRARHKMRESLDPEWTAQ